MWISSNLCGGTVVGRGTEGSSLVQLLAVARTYWPVILSDSQYMQARSDLSNMYWSMPSRWQKLKVFGM